jgi:hypothetical protein
MQLIPSGDAATLVYFSAARSRAIMRRSREVARDFASTGHRKLIDRPGDPLIAGLSATPQDRRHGECPRFVKDGDKAWPE